MKYSRTKVANAVVDMIAEHGRAKAAQALAEVLLATNSKIDKELLMKDIARATEQKHSIANIHIESVHQLNASNERDVTEYLKQAARVNDAVVTTEINPQLIGGLRARSAELEIDWSVSRKLKELHQGE